MEKRVALSGGGGGEGGEGGRWRSWEDMNPEVLALIFVRMPTDVLARTVPFVCRSWRDAVAGPYCWSEIDLDKWCRRVDLPDVIDAAIRPLVRRSRGTLRRLSAYRLGNSSFSYAAASGILLSVLQMPMSDVTDQMVEKHAGSLSNLTVLDISYCLNITSKGLEVLGKQCNALVQLRRNMPPPEFETTQDDGVAAKLDEGEAMAIANNMAGLKHLELTFGRFSELGLAAILTKCTALHVLDIRGCWSVKMECNIESMCNKIQSYKDPWHDEYEDADSLVDETENRYDDDESRYDDDDAGLVDVDTSDESDD